MNKNKGETNPIKDAETAVFLSANRIISDTQKMRTDPAETIASFEEHTKILALAALELIAYHAGPEQAQQLIKNIMSHNPGASEVSGTIQSIAN